MQAPLELSLGTAEVRIIYYVVLPSCIVKENTELEEHHFPWEFGHPRGPEAKVLRSPKRKVSFPAISQVALCAPWLWE